MATPSLAGKLLLKRTKDVGVNNGGGGDDEVENKERTNDTEEFAREFLLKPLEMTLEMIKEGEDPIAVLMSDPNSLDVVDKQSRVIRKNLVEKNPETGENLLHQLAYKIVDLVESDPQFRDSFDLALEKKNGRIVTPFYVIDRTPDGLSLQFIFWPPSNPSDFRNSSKKPERMGVPIFFEVGAAGVSGTTVDRLIPQQMPKLPNMRRTILFAGAAILLAATGYFALKKFGLTGEVKPVENPSTPTPNFTNDSVTATSTSTVAPTSTPTIRPTETAIPRIIPEVFMKESGLEGYKVENYKQFILDLIENFYPDNYAVYESRNLVVFDKFGLLHFAKSFEDLLGLIERDEITSAYYFGNPGRKVVRGKNGVDELTTETVLNWIKEGGNVCLVEHTKTTISGQVLYGKVEPWFESRLPIPVMYDNEGNNAGILLRAFDAEGKISFSAKWDHTQGDFYTLLDRVFLINAVNIADLTFEVFPPSKRDWNEVHRDWVRLSQRAHGN